jgi:hypothetical protein
VAAPFLASACIVHTRATILDPKSPRQATCPAAVRLFASADEVRKPYVALARLSIWYHPDMMPTPDDEQESQRKQAAEFWANGIILGHSLRTRQFPWDTTTAIFIPDDSLRTAQLCAEARGHR